MIPLYLLWTQRFEKFHQVFKIILAKKKGLRWSFLQYCLGIVQNVVKDSIEGDDENHRVSGANTSRPIRYLFKREEKEEIEEIRGVEFCVRSKVEFTKDRVLRVGDWVRSEDQVMCLEEILVNEEVILVSGIKYNLQQSDIPFCKLAVKEQPQDEENLDKWFLNDCDKVHVIVLGDHIYCNLIG
ncbi:hypothetical protein AKO1_013481 [Acrasis kona]|uniref:Uncharacterized protein n=1 Tax=Acrasis kona TaxID=1008807 RepID=A0AAW2YL17_9EUKA